MPAQSALAQSKPAKSGHPPRLPAGLITRCRPSHCVWSRQCVLSLG